MKTALKITFEMSHDAALQAALNAGAPSDEEAKLFAIGIKRRSRFKKLVKYSSQYRELMDNQNNGYHIVQIEVPTE